LKKVKIALITASCVISYLAGAYLGKKTLKEIEIVEVEKVQIRERAVTVIKELPDGTKTTTIKTIKDTDTVNNKQLKSKETPVENKWSVWASVGSRLDARPEPTYTIGFDYKWLLGSSVGLYGRTDGELGVTLRYSF
jgi:hypothetical protein